MSCVESSVSICAIRALIIAWVSFETVMVPAMTWSTNSPIRSLASVRLLLVAGHAALRDDLVEEADLLAATWRPTSAGFVRRLCSC